jgi:protocatechuate 3,4-dioxygenase beta subunit
MIDQPLDDDAPIGRVLSRREVLVLFGATGAAAFVAACMPTGSSSPGTATSTRASATPAAPSASGVSAIPFCIVRPELTEGPYFVDEMLQRSDIRSDPSDGSLREGLPLGLTFAVSRISGSACEPFEGALVDVWHCDALGVYSDVQDPGFDTSGQKWLRGYQVTDANGVAAFTTIYPGWYQGRTVHIHFKIRTDAAAESGLEFTSQLFFDDAVSDQVFASEPYLQKGQRTLRNDGDNIFNQSGGELTLQLSGDQQNGYATTFEIGIQA